MLIDTHDDLTPAQHRALVREAVLGDRPGPFTPEALWRALTGTGRWADVEGISREEIDAFSAGAAELARRGRTADAADVLRYLVAIDPFEPRHTLALGCLAMEDEDWEQAERLFEVAIEAHGGDLGAHAGRALARLHRGDLAGASDDAARALLFDPAGDNPLTARMALELHRAGGRVK